MESDEPVGEILRGRNGIPEHPDFRRQRHFDGIFGAHEQGDEQRKWLREISDQRACRRKKEIAGGRISGVLQWRGCPAYRHGHEEHRENRDRIGAAADAFFRNHPAQGREEFRERQFQSPIRSTGARTGSPREFIKEDRNAVLSKTWRNSAKTSYLVSSQWRRAHL